MLANDFENQNSYATAVNGKHIQQIPLLGVGGTPHNFGWECAARFYTNYM